MPTVTSRSLISAGIAVGRPQEEGEESSLAAAGTRWQQQMAGISPAVVAGTAPQAAAVAAGWRILAATLLPLAA